MSAVPLRLTLLSVLIALVYCESSLPRNFQPPRKSRSKLNSYAPQQPADSPTSFGFVPVKTAANYIQKEPLGRYVYPELLRQQYTQAKFTHYRTQPPYNPQVSHYASVHQPQHQQSVAAYVQPENQHVVQNFIQPPQQYVQQYVQPSQEYVYQTQQPQYYYQPDVKNVNYITDNHVPQYVYVQQMPEPSNTVENVVDPKDQGVRYIMLIPTYVPQQTDTANYYVTKQTDNQNIVAGNVPTYDYQQQQQPQHHHHQQQQQQQHHQQQQQHEQPQQPEQQQQYVYNTIEISKSPGYKINPSSLLDSYVPSILQVQYHKKLTQSLDNEITDSTKALSQNSKKDKRENEN